MSDGADSKTAQSGWQRSRWLAEKVASGELPAATCDLTRQCDTFFVGHDRLEDHARVLAHGTSADANERRGDRGRRAEDVMVYLQRLLALREMWARERC
jgi:hypothetical protein